jgi:hypothetical protein
LEHTIRDAAITEMPRELPWDATSIMRIWAKLGENLLVKSSVMPSKPRIEPAVVRGVDAVFYNPCFSWHGLRQRSQPLLTQRPPFVHSGPGGNPASHRMPRWLKRTLVEGQRTIKVVALVVDS